MLAILGLWQFLRLTQLSKKLNLKNFNLILQFIQLDLNPFFQNHLDLK